MGILSPGLILSIIAGYFLILIFISWRTSRRASNEDFFIASHQSPWYLVAFGMIGASLSGVTFISVPGWVEASNFSYMQMVAGYIVGYMLIATVLMPLYYRLRLTSIYGYLEDRFGPASYRTGAGFFLLSRTIGASFRLFLVAIVLQEFVMGPMGISYMATVGLTILLIWIYTFRGGIKTIVWTDSLQTLCMLAAVVLSIYVIAGEMNWTIPEMISHLDVSPLSKVFFFEGGWSDSKNFFKLFISGAAIALVMTGLDQDMMQKNLSCRNLADAQKNMFWFSGVLVIANLFFLTLGALLYLYIANAGIEIPTRLIGDELKPATDLLFPEIALNHMPVVVGVFFVLGLIAAAYSSADSALTSLTTSFCVDFLGFEHSSRSESDKTTIRMGVHIGFSLLLFLVIMIFWWINDRAVIDALFRVATYTYGPLLGLYAFGFFRKNAIRDRWTPLVCLLSPVLTWLVYRYSTELFWGYRFGYELLLINGLFTFLGLYIISHKRPVGT